MKAGIIDSRARSTSLFGRALRLGVRVQPLDSRASDAQRQFVAGEHSLGWPETPLGLRCGLFAGVVAPLPDTRQNGLFLGLEGCGLIGQNGKRRLDLVKAGLFGGCGVVHAGIASQPLAVTFQ